MHQDYLDLLQCLNESKVKYLIIGGYAVIYYAEPRYTKDLDIWIEASDTNAKRTIKALEKFGAPVSNLTVEELAKPGLIYVFGIAPLRVDILNKVKGCKFETAWKNKSREKINDVKANLVSKKDLIKIKKKTNRAQDRADLIALNR